MAFEKDILDQEEEQEEQGMQPLTQPLNSAPSGGAQSATSQRKPASKPGSGMFTNIQKYYKQPKSGANQMASKIGESYQKRFDDIKSGAQEKVGKFNEIYQPEQQRLQTASERVGQYIQQAGTPVSQEQADSRRTEIERLRAGQYQDPTDIDLSEQKLETDQLQSQLTDPSRENATRQALKSVYERPSYFQGMRNLDYLMMRQQDPQNIMREKASDVSQQVSDYDIGNVESQIQQKDRELGDFARTYKTGGERDFAPNFQTAEDQLRQNIMDREAAERQQRFDAVKDLNPYVTGYAGDITEGQLINQEDIARANALRNLSSNEGFQFAEQNPYDLDAVKSKLGNSTTDTDRLLEILMGSKYNRLTMDQNNVHSLGQSNYRNYGDSEQYLTPEGVEKGSLSDIQNYIRQQVTNYNPHAQNETNPVASFYQPEQENSLLGKQESYDLNPVNANNIGSDVPYDPSILGNVKGYRINDENLTRDIIPRYLQQQQQQIQAAKESGYEVDDSFLKDMSGIYERYGQHNPYKYKG